MNAALSKLQYAFFTLMVFILDQLLKTRIRSLPSHAAAVTVPGFAEITHYTNTGAAFSMLSGYTPWIAAFSVCLILLLLVYLLRSMRLTKGAAYALAALIGGGLGNLYDRVVYGGVTDYIRLLFIPFPVFNFADICITVSVAILALDLLTGRLDRHPEESSHGSDH